MSGTRAVKTATLIIRSAVLSALALVSSLVMCAAQRAAGDSASDRTGAGKWLERLVEATPPERAYRKLDALLDDPAWKVGALKLIEMRRSSDAGASRAAAASRSSTTVLPVVQAPMHILELASDADPLPAWTCKVDATDGKTSAHQALTRGVFRLGAWFDSDTVEVALSCHESGCLFGCDRSAQQRVRLSSLPRHIDSGEPGVVVQLLASKLDPDAESGGNASPRTPLVITAASAVAQIDPYADHVNYRALDATDFVRVYPARAATSALLCARVPLRDAVRVTADASDDAIGAFVLDGRCVAASVQRWEVLQFQIVARTPETAIDYEVIALSGGTRPDLALVAWFVARRLVTDTSLTRAEVVRATRELLDVFGVNLEADSKTADVVGDPTLRSFVHALATIAQGAP